MAHSQLDLLAPGGFRDFNFRNGRYFSEARTTRRTTAEQEMLYQFSRNAVETLCNKYKQGLEFQFKNTRLTAIRKYQLYPYTAKFLFGYQTMIQFYKYGWNDYPTVRAYILRYYPRLREAVRLQAVGLVILHEFSHVIQRSQIPYNTSRGGITAHGIEFKRIFRALIAENTDLVQVSHLVK